MLAHTITTATLIEMLSWRWASARIARLRSFRLAYTGATSPAFDEDVVVHHEFQRLKQEGMILYVGGARPDDSFPDSTAMYLDI